MHFHVMISFQSMDELVSIPMEQVRNWPLMLFGAPVFRGRSSCIRPERKTHRQSKSALKIGRALCRYGFEIRFLAKSLLFRSFRASPPSSNPEWLMPRHMPMLKHRINACKIVIEVLAVAQKISSPHWDTNKLSKGNYRTSPLNQYLCRPEQLGQQPASKKRSVSI